MKRLFVAVMCLVLAGVCPAKFMGYLKEDTAITLKLGPFVDRTDGVTMETGLDIDHTDVMLSKANGDYAAKNDATDNAPDDDDGFYEIALDATDTSTIGLLQIKIDVDAAHVPMTFEFYVLPVANYNVLFVTAPDAAGGLPIVGSLMGLTNDAITNAKIAASGAVEIQAGLNYPNASTELDGAVEGTSLSTTRIIYLTATSANNDKQYESGRIVAFVDANGIYHYGEIDYYDSTNDVIYLKYPVPVAPVNLTPIYSLSRQGGTGSVPIPPPAGGTLVTSGTVQALVGEFTGVSYVMLDPATASANAGFYNQMTIKVTYVGGTYAGVNYEGTIFDYTGNDGSPFAYRVATFTPFPETPTTGDLYEIYTKDPAGTGSDFGPNAGKAVAEKAGSAAGSTLSTTTTIYLTANTVDSIYAAGTTVRFLDSSGLYHDAVIYTNVSDVLTLDPAAAAAPADGTIIYPLGIGYTSTQNLTTAAVYDIWAQQAAPFSSATGTLGKVLYDVYTSAPLSISGGIALTGSTRSHLLFDSPIITGGGYLSVDRCWAIYTDTSSGYNYPVFIVKSTAGVTDSIDIFPTLPVAPAEADTIVIYPSVVGLTPMDVMKYSGR